MLLKALKSHNGLITQGKVYESILAEYIPDTDNLTLVLIYTDNREWTNMDLKLFEPAIERS